jgi:hypothetical protein
MRRAGAVVVALALCAGAALAASKSPPAPQYSPEEAHVGCMHTDLRPCMITLGAVLMFDMNVVAPQIAKRNEMDVNGKTAHRTIVIAASAPGHPVDRVGIILTLASPAPNDTVVKAEIWLPNDPQVAHTPSEYDRTLMFDAVQPLLGNRCPGLDRTTLYRFFENTVKPAEIVKVDQQQKSGFFQHVVETVDANTLPLCGAQFSFHRHVEWDASAQNPEKRAVKLATFIDLE